MIDQKEVRHLIKQNKRIKEKIAEQARVFQEEKTRLKSMNRSLRKTLEEEKQRNQATIEEFNAQIAALEAELRRAKNNEPQVTSMFSTPTNRTIKPISFSQLEAENRRLAEETNRIIQQSQMLHNSTYYSSTIKSENSSPYQSKFIPVPNYRTKFQFSMSNNSNYNNNISQIPQNQPPQKSTKKKNHSKTTPQTKSQNNGTFSALVVENNNVQQLSPEKPANKPLTNNNQVNSNTLPAPNKSHEDFMNEMYEEEEESLTYNEEEKDKNAPNEYSSDATIPEDGNQANQSEQTPNNSKSDINKSNSAKQSQTPASTKATKDAFQNTTPVQNPAKNQIPKDDENKANKVDNKAFTSPEMPVIINDPTENSFDPFEDNFSRELKEHNEIKQEEEPKKVEKPPTTPKKEEPKKTEQKTVQQQDPPKPKATVNNDPFVNDSMSGIFDNIPSFNHDAFSEIDDAFNDHSQTNDTQANNDKPKKTDDKKQDKKEIKDDLDDINVPSADSFFFPTNQIVIEGID